MLLKSYTVHAFANPQFSLLNVFLKKILRLSTGGAECVLFRSVFGKVLLDHAEHSTLALWFKNTYAASDDD